MYDKVLEEIKSLIPDAKKNGQYYTANVLEKAAAAIEELSKRVPKKPHGDLIDRDALIAKLNMMIAMAFGEGNTAFHFAYRSLGKVVENAPTVLEAEEGE